MKALIVIMGSKAIQVEWHIRDQRGWQYHAIVEHGSIKHRLEYAACTSWGCYQINMVASDLISIKCRITCVGQYLPGFHIGDYRGHIMHMVMTVSKCVPIHHLLRLQL
ncbi:hypothetical protein EVA_15293 [gut metagenome]|uniref:Uncharacterized protein n=1 Tax=gut metagenome TaxID=749906 RepID=J9C9P0_9ZZZZ